MYKLDEMEKREKMDKWEEIDKCKKMNRFEKILTKHKTIVTDLILNLCLDNVKK